MATDKKISYMVQGGVKNYKPSKMVTVPKKAKSSPKHPETELAYITKAEKKLLIKKNLHGSLKGKVNKGPGGIMSLNGGYNEPGGFQSGQDIGAAETGQTTGHGMSADEAAGYRNAAIAAGAQRTTQDDINDYNRAQWNERFTSFKDRKSRDPRGFNWGNLGRGIMSVVGGIPGKIGSFLSTIGGKFKGKDLANATTTAIENDPDYLSDMDTGYARTHLSTLANKMAPVESITPVEKPTVTEEVVDDTFDETNTFAKDGGRIGYRSGLGVDPVLDVQEDENTLEFMNDQGIPYGEMAQGPSPFEMRIQELMDTGMSWQEAYNIASEEFGQVVEEESDQGIASLV
jgi:hypothetical protein